MPGPLGGPRLGQSRLIQAAPYCNRILPAVSNACHNECCVWRAIRVLGRYYAFPALVKASIASERVGNIRKTRSTFVISKTFSTRRLTPVSAMRRPALAQVVQALTSDPSPEESR